MQRSKDGVELGLFQLHNFIEIIRVALILLRVNGMPHLPLLSQVNRRLPALRLLLLFLQTQMRAEHFHQTRLAAVGLQLHLNRNHQILVILVTRRPHPRPLRQLMRKDPLHHSLVLHCLVRLNGQNEDIVVQLRKGGIVGFFCLEIEVPRQDQSAKDDQVGNSNVQLELHPLLVPLLINQPQGLLSDSLNDSFLKHPRASPTSLRHSPLPRSISSQQFIFRRTLEQHWQGFHREGRIRVQSRLFEAVNAVDAPYTKPMLDEQGFEEGFGMIESLKCAFVAPEGLGQCVLLIILHFLLYTNNIIIHNSAI